MFGWNTVGIITTSEEIWKTTAEAARDGLVDHGKVVFFRVIATTVQGDRTDAKRLQDLQETLAAMKKQVRIFFTFSYQVDLEHLLFAARKEGMITREYTFVVKQFHNGLAKDYPYKGEVYQEVSDGLLGVSLKTPSGQKFDDFLQRVIDELQDPYYDDVPHVPADAKIGDINILAGG